MRRLRFLLVLPALLLALAGCTSIERTVTPGRDPAALREVFVAANLNDNHGLARRIAAALREAGLRAEHGPLTLLPETAEAVVNYQGPLGLDFGDHLVYLQISLRDPDEVRPYASATRSKHIERSTDLSVVVPELVSELLAPVVEK